MIAAYEHCDMIKSHYHIANALDECLKKLENGTRNRQVAVAVGSAHRMALQPGMDVSFQTSESVSLETYTTDDSSSEHGFDEVELLVRSNGEGGKTL